MVSVEELHRLMGDVINVRRWQSKAVPEPDLQQLLVALGLGPSTTQPWEVLQLDSREARQAAVSATLEPMLTPGTKGAQSWLLEAPVVLAVCVEARRARARMGERGQLIALQEVGGAIQNFRVAANALGLRTCVVREFHPDPMREVLGLPWFLEPAALLVVGYSDSYLEYPPRYTVPEFHRVYEPPPRQAPEGEATAPVGRALAAPREGGATQSAILRRRSVRHFTGEPLTPEMRDQLLAAAVRAPSAGNMQPWEFLLIEDSEARKAAVATTYSGYFAGPDNQQTWIMNSSLLIGICLNRRRSAARYGPEISEIALLDMGAAVENLLVTAVELGLGACWVGGFKRGELARQLGIPEGVELISLVAVGHPASVPGLRPRLPLDLVTHRDRWGVQYYSGKEDLARLGEGVALRVSAVETAG